MSGETKVAIFTVVCSAIVSVATLYSNHKLQEKVHAYESEISSMQVEKDKILQSQKHEFDLKMATLKHEHELEKDSIKESVYRKKDRCLEIDNLISQLAVSWINEGNIKKDDYASYMKSVSYLKPDDYKKAGSEKQEYKDFIHIMVSRLSEERSKCLR